MSTAIEWDGLNYIYQDHAGAMVCTDGTPEKDLIVLRDTEPFACQCPNCKYIFEQD